MKDENGAPMTFSQLPGNADEPFPFVLTRTELMAQRKRTETIPSQPPTNLEGGEQMTNQTNTTPSLKVKAVVDELDLKSSTKRSITVTVIEGTILKGTPVTVNVMITQGRATPKGLTNTFHWEGEKWIARFAIIDKDGRAQVYSPDRLFEEVDVTIPDMSDPSLDVEAAPTEKTEVTFVRPDFDEGSDVASDALKTQEDPPKPRALPQPVPAPPGLMGKPKGVVKTMIDVSADGEPMPAPTVAAPASSDGFEEAPPTKEMQNPALSAKVLDSLANQEDLVHVPEAPPKIVAKIEELRSKKAEPAKPTAVRADFMSSSLELPDGTSPTRHTQHAQDWPSEEAAPAPELAPALPPEPRPEPAIPLPSLVSAPAPKPAVRMGPAPPPPPAPIQSMPPPTVQPTELATTSPLESLFENVPQVPVAPETPLTAPPIPHDAGEVEEAEELAAELEPVPPPKKKMTLVDRAQYVEPVPEQKPKPEPNPQQQPPSPTPGAKERPMSTQEKKSGISAVVAVLVVIIVLLIGFLVIGFYTLRAEKEEAEKAGEGAKGRVEAKDAGPHFGDARDDQAFTVDRPPAKPCVVLLDLKTRQGIPLSDWNKTKEIVVHPVTERPLVVVSDIPGQSTDLYEARWNAKWELDCEGLRPYYK